MRIRISAPRTQPPLKVLSELPSDDLSLLEGQNGIGKTLALKVVQLCTGDTSSWSDDGDLWRSFCELLGPVEVAIDDLVERNDDTAVVHNIRWAFDLSDHSAERPSALHDSDFTVLEIDGRQATLAAVRELFEVERVDGSEDMPQTLRRLINEEARVVELAVARLRWGSGQLERQFVSWTDKYAVDVCRAFLDADKETRAKQAELANVTEESRRVEIRTNLLAQAANAIHLLDEVRGSTARKLEEKKEDLRIEIEKLDQQERARAQALNAVTAAHDAQSALSADLQKAERVHKRRLKTLQDRTKDAESAASKYGAQDSATIEALAATVAEKLEQANRQLAEIAAATGIAPITEDLREVLTRARENEFGDRTVAVLPDRTLNAMQLLAAVDRRREQLASTAAGKQVGDLNEQIASLEVDSAQLANILRLFVLVGNAERNLEETNTDLESLKARTDPNSAERQQAELTATLNGIRDTLTNYRVALALTEEQLDRLGAGRSAVDLESDRDRYLDEAEITVDELAAELDRSAVRLAAVTGHIATLQARIDDLANTLELAGERIDEIIETHAGTDVPVAIQAGMSRADAAVAVVELQSRITEQVQQNRDVTDRAARVANALNALVDQLRRGNSKAAIPESQIVFDRMRDRWEQQLLKNFGTRAVAISVFDGGELVRVNLEERQFEWTVGPDTRIRPFSGFSSGEQAFAYTQARITELGGRRAASKLLAIDEFGAYLSADRRSRLITVIDEAVRGGRITQALLVLPLRLDLDSPDVVLPPNYHQSLDVAREQKWLSAPLLDVGAV